MTSRHIWLKPMGEGVCVTWFEFHFLKLVCDPLKIICYSGAWQIKGSHRFFWHSSHWRVGSIFIPLKSGQALWLFWPIEYGERDTLPVFPAYVFTNWQLLTSSVLEHLPMYLPTRLRGGLCGSCCGPCKRDKPRETQPRECCTYSMSDQHRRGFRASWWWIKIDKYLFWLCLSFWPTERWE